MSEAMMSAPMTRADVIRVLREAKEEAGRRYKVRLKGIFGSFAREQGRAGSDVDVLVEFEQGANLLHFVGLSLFLEERLRLPVDVVPVDTIREEIRGRALDEAAYL